MILLKFQIFYIRRFWEKNSFCITDILWSIAVCLEVHIKKIRKYYSKCAMKKWELSKQRYYLKGYEHKIKTSNDIS